MQVAQKAADGGRKGLFPRPAAGSIAGRCPHGLAGGQHGLCAWSEGAVAGGLCCPPRERPEAIKDGGEGAPVALLKGGKGFYCVEEPDEQIAVQGDCWAQRPLGADGKALAARLGGGRARGWRAVARAGGKACTLCQMAHKRLQGARREGVEPLDGTVIQDVPGDEAQDADDVLKGPLGTLS